MRAVLAFCLAAILLSPAVEPPPAVFTVGLLRRDALVVPFATYDGKHWKDHWPDPATSVDVPINLQNIPKKWWGPTGPLATWQVWAGPQPQTVHVRQPDWLDAYCQKQVGLRTDYTPRVWPPTPDTKPYPKDGLAVSPPQPVLPIERISPESGETATIGGLLRDAYAKQEEQAITRAEEAGADVRPDKRALEQLPITIESLYAIGTTRRVYWVESSREYAEGHACAAVLYGTGWLILDGGRLVNAAFSIDMVPCNRQTLLYMLPLGLMKLPTGTYWIAQFSGWDREGYTIFDVGETDVRQELGVSGGGCPNE